LKALNDLSAIYGYLLVIFWLSLFYHFSALFVNSLLCNNKFFAGRLPAAFSAFS